jgi:hypothetical protein
MSAPTVAALASPVRQRWSRGVRVGFVTLDPAVLALPDDPALADVARALEAGGFAAELWDASWRLAYTTTEFRTIVSAGRQGTEIAGLGEHILSPAMSAVRESWPAGPTFDSFRESLRDWGGLVLETSPGGQSLSSRSPTRASRRF